MTLEEQRSEAEAALSAVEPLGPPWVYRGSRGHKGNWGSIISAIFHFFLREFQGFCRDKKKPTLWV